MKPDNLRVVRLVGANIKVDGQKTDSTARSLGDLGERPVRIARTIVNDQHDILLRVYKLFGDLGRDCRWRLAKIAIYHHRCVKGILANQIIEQGLGESRFPNPRQAD